MDKKTDSRENKADTASKDKAAGTHKAPAASDALATDSKAPVTDAPTTKSPDTKSTSGETVPEDENKEPETVTSTLGNPEPSGRLMPPPVVNPFID